MRLGGSLFSSCVLVLFAVPLIASLPTSAPAHVVINEVLYDPEGSDTGYEFVELMNCGHDGVLLTGWVLETGNGAHPDDWTVEWIGDDLDYLAPGGIFLIGESDVVPAPDYVAPLDLQNGPDGVRLTDGAAVVDVVGWGEPLFHEYYEGRPAADAPSGSGLARSPDCYDHDDNATDFIVCATPTPGVRNALEFDLAVEPRHSGRMVFDAAAAVVVSCVVRNVGSLSTEGETPLVQLLLDGSDSPVSSVAIDAPLAPRDSLEIALEWGGPTVGYHRARVRVACPSDVGPANDEAETSFTVGRPGGLLTLNEIMYSPDEGGTEWIELVNATGDTAAPSGWMLGDDVDAHTVVPLEGDTLAAVAPGGYLVLAKDAELLEGTASCPVAETEGWEALSSDDVVVVLDEFGTPIDRVEYEDRWGGARGVSLERVRADMPADDPNNWGSCVAPEGSTPGRRNSIHIEAAPSAGRLVVSPNPFTPDGDGVDDRTVIRFDLPVAQATARLSVFDLRGRKRAVLLDHAAVSSRGEVIWDGAGQDGGLLPSGLYVVLLEAINARQGVLVEAKAAVAIVR